MFDVPQILTNGQGNPEDVYKRQVQDIQGVIHLAPEMAVEKIRFMLSAQVDNGGGLPLVKFTHNPGHEDTVSMGKYQCILPGSGRFLRKIKANYLLDITETNIISLR